MKTLIVLVSLLLSEHSILIAKEIKLSHNTDYTPIFVWNANLLKLSNVDTPVDNSIKVGSKCPECKGTGTWVSGDGIHKKPCPHCLADGKVDTDDPILTGIYSTQEPEQEVPPSYNVKDPPLTDGTDSSPEKSTETEVRYFNYKGVSYYYKQDIDRFVSLDGSKLKVNLSMPEWIKEGSINICRYDDNGNEIECTNCKLSKVTTPANLFQEKPAFQFPSDYATPDETVDRILQSLSPLSTETFLDIGSGDGKVAIQAAKLYGCKAIGIEIDPDRIVLAKQNAEQAGVSHLVTFIQGDFNTLQWPRADVGYCYLFPEDLTLIKDNLLKLDRFASFSHQVPTVSMYSNNQGEYYTWKSLPKSYGVLYGNRIYTRPVCNKRNCSMCAYIRSELAKQGM